MSADGSSAPLRRRYIDWARGLAVLIMIHAHTLDAWTRPSARTGKTFSYLVMLGGFAAPLFLWLAGMVLVLAAERRMATTGSRAAVAEALVARGAEIFILAFLFRLQAFIVSPGSPLLTLFRVDILNVMGPAIVLAGLLWYASGGTRAAAVVCSMAAVATAMSTPLVRDAEWVNHLHVWIQWYLRPAGNQTTFTLLPWAGFLLAGAACGAGLATVRDGTERLTFGVLAAAGALLIVTGFYAASRPTIYAHSQFWSSSPTYFAIRAGGILLGLTAFYALTPLQTLLPRPFTILETFGRNSLFIYWIHVDLVYGYTTWVIRHRLPLWGTELAFIVFTIAMYQAIPFRDRIVTAWRVRRQQRAASTPQPAGA